MYRFSKDSNSILIERPNGEVLAFHKDLNLSATLLEDSNVAVQNKYDEQVVELMHFNEVEVGSIAYADKKELIVELNDLFLFD